MLSGYPFKSEKIGLLDLEAQAQRALAQRRRQLPPAAPANALGNAVSRDGLAVSQPKAGHVFPVRTLQFHAHAALARSRIDRQASASGPERFGHKLAAPVGAQADKAVPAQRRPRRPPHARTVLVERRSVFVPHQMIAVPATA